MSKARGRTLADRRFRFTSEDRWGYFFIFVAMVVFVTFTLYPVVSAVRTSFLKYKPFGSEFIGLKNYIDTFKSALFYKAVKNTIVYTAVVVPLSLLIAFSIAIMILPFKKKTQSLFKSVYYLPGIASGVALSVVWLWLYDSSPDGLFNQVLMFFGIPSQNWLSSSKTSMLSLMLMAILSGQGSNIIIYIAALLGIDNSYFEAAELDGATFFQKVRYIVFPLVKPTTLFLLVTGIIGSFQVFQNAFMMTGGGPDNRTPLSTQSSVSPARRLSCLPSSLRSFRSCSSSSWARTSNTERRNGMATTGLYSPHVNHPEKRIARNILLAVILILFALLTLFPIFYMIMSSFGPAVATAGTSRSIFPRVWTLDSYKAFFAFSKYSVRWIVNSLIVASATVAGNVIFASMAGYAFSKIRFKGRQWLFGLILVAMMIPYQVTQVPLYILIANKLHMTNTYAAMILPGVVTSYNIFLAKQFFTSIPTPLIESAKLDGCSQLGIFVRIILPLSKTVLAVMAINTFLSSWNTFFWPFLVTSKDYIFTIQVGLKTFKFANETLFAPMMAGATLSALPMFILFFTLQKYFLEGVTIGAVKG